MKLPDLADYIDRILRNLSRCLESVSVSDSVFKVVEHHHGENVDIEITYLMNQPTSALRGQQGKLNESKSG